MGPRELRIGNWVKQGRANVQVTGAMIQEINQELLDVNPIPLTEEWLLKFGFNFVKSTHDEAECYDYFYNLLYLNMANHSISINGKCVLSFIPDYVHQLQNLYFALTGEELTIKQS